MKAHQQVGTGLKDLEDHSFVFFYMPVQAVIPVDGGSAQGWKVHTGKRGVGSSCLEFWITHVTCHEDCGKEDKVAFPVQETPGLQKSKFYSSKQESIFLKQANFCTCYVSAWEIHCFVQGVPGKPPRGWVKRLSDEMEPACNCWKEGHSGVERLPRQVQRP